MTKIDRDPKIHVMKTMFPHLPGRLPLRTITLLLVILSFVQVSLADQADDLVFVDIGAALTGVWSSSIAWGDPISRTS